MHVLDIESVLIKNLVLDNTVRIVSDNSLLMIHVVDNEVVPIENLVCENAVRIVSGITLLYCMYKILK